MASLRSPLCLLSAIARSLSLSSSLFLCVPLTPKRSPRRPLKRLLAPSFYFRNRARRGTRKTALLQERERERELCISFDIVVRVCGDDAPALAPGESARGDTDKIDERSWFRRNLRRFPTFETTTRRYDLPFAQLYRVLLTTST